MKCSGVEQSTMTSVVVPKHMKSSGVEQFFRGQLTVLCVFGCMLCASMVFVRVVL